MKSLLAVFFLVWAAAAHGSWSAEDALPLSLGKIEGKGQVADPTVSPSGELISFEFLSANGETLEVYTAALAVDEKNTIEIRDVKTLLPKQDRGVFSLGSAEDAPASEHVSWGPPKRKGDRLVLAVTRKAKGRGGNEINFDLLVSERGKRSFLTSHPANDAQPSFSLDGDYIAFSSGRSGQGDIYLYDFFASTDPLIQVTYDVAGSEINPTWGPKGKQLAFIGHLRGQDHLFVIDDASNIIYARGTGERRAVARKETRNLTPGWEASCLAASFSPDGKALAFFARKGEGESADLYVAPLDETAGEPRLLFHGVIPGTRRGPVWSPTGDGLFIVKDDAKRMNPMMWIPLEKDLKSKDLKTGTELNADPFVAQRGTETFLLFAAQGSSDVNQNISQKRWRRIFVSKLKQTED